MKKNISITAFLLFFGMSNLSFGQSYNIVPNSGFQLEDPGGAPQCRDAPFDDKTFSDNILYWEVAKLDPVLDPIITPDWFDTDLCDYNIWPWPIFSPSNRFAGLALHNNQEGVRVQLLQKLRGGKYYTLRLKIANYEYTTGHDVKLRIHLTKFGLHWDANPDVGGNVQLKDIVNFIIPANSPSKWRNFEHTFYVPTDMDNELENLIIITHYDDAINPFYCFIDDAELFESVEYGCISSKAIENTLYHYNELPIEVSQSIVAGSDIGAPTTNGNVLVGPQAIVEYKAGQEITLKDGFSVERGGDFHAYIAPCGFDCTGAYYTEDLSTGVTDGVINIPGIVDDDWNYVSDNNGSTPNPDDLITMMNIPAQWTAAGTNAAWINPAGSGFGAYPDGYNKFECEFALPPASDLRDVSIKISQVAVDNSAKVYLNNHQILGLGFLVDIPSLDIVPAPWPGSDFCSNDNFEQIHGPYNILDPSKFIYNGTNKLTVEIYNNATGTPCLFNQPSNPAFYTSMGLFMNAELKYWKCGYDPNANCKFTDEPIQFAAPIVATENNGITLIPNPSQDYFTVRSLYNAAGTIEIMNIPGNIVFRSAFNGELSVTELSMYPRGLYFVRVRTIDGHEFVEKLILK